ncbi:twin-arginine translocase subunit TatC [Heyndrickxia oleronia]|jgi:sec-independent protein translocase protein TatC|uniref:twin-arginine translocase subunit TatC n=1 Tax=Heyndrickxia oleronia TaxID=38875 RepID=UPI0007173DA0|nr:twin-arginine translocase subunit TatC [Heyndrickxia oleronia]NYV68422.1 twin-arginine translocase subunit TatC [Bacillus sp. Gen3]MBU5214836.1 twin-arginine translocase subunit TatC [Heyndrickxia oleronia]MCI1591767.1 twin-arginine translocase subunit TatC [Heyndrickxia oleronia]MCI1614967.1 twin-arginine translocase subunit TatC [Heyndrickxia oleronia]MCI1745834.1 twin-arginine translocase subunit TatC [Heyndrickxia oleronia]
MSQKDMTIFEHISELRKRLFVIVVFFILAVIVSFFLSQPLIRYLQESDLAKEITMNAFRLTDPFKVFMEMTLYLALVIILPVILYQLWAFISPGLYEKERKVTLSYIPAAVLLFLAGIAFSYFILFPLILKFMMQLSSQMNINPVIGINEYFSFLFQITLPFGLLFELPIIILFLTRLGIITPMFLAKIRKYAYFLLIVLAAFITPPDVMSQIIVAIPLMILYEISIWLSKIGYRKSKAAELRYELERESE